MTSEILLDHFDITINGGPYKFTINLLSRSNSSGGNSSAAAIRLAVRSALRIVISLFEFMLMVFAIVANYFLAKDPHYQPQSLQYKASEKYRASRLRRGSISIG